MPRHIIAKVSRDEVLEKFVSPPDAEAVKNLVNAGLLTETEGKLASRVPVADDITVEADSGGHTDGRSSFVGISAKPHVGRCRETVRENSICRSGADSRWVLSTRG